MDKKKAVRTIRKAAREGRIVICDQDRIDLIPVALQADFLEKIFDVTRALITDESQLSDFRPFHADDDRREQWARATVIRIRELYGVECQIDDYICHVLEAIQHRQK